MGTHNALPPGAAITAPGPIQMISVQAWTVMDKTMITAYATYAVDLGPRSLNIGADTLDYKLLHLPSLGQVMWCLGDEIRQGWRELSSPKA